MIVARDWNAALRYSFKCVSERLHLKTLANYFGCFSEDLCWTLRSEFCRNPRKRRQILLIFLVIPVLVTLKSWLFAQFLLQRATHFIFPAQFINAMRLVRWLSSLIEIHRGLGVLLFWNIEALVLFALVNILTVIASLRSNRMIWDSISVRIEF